jgi:hypothetical protein
MEASARVKILNIVGEYVHNTEKQVIRRQVISVAELHKRNPYGHTQEIKTAFEIDVYNHNIELFGIKPTMVGEIADVQMDVRMVKKGSGPAVAQFIVTDFTIRM